ncbi:MAG: ABC transporter six-transmembrane domain-containing protein [Pseudomonadota bacterium]
MTTETGRRLNITHQTIIARYWGSILGTMSLMLVASFISVLQPFALGVAINDLVEGSWGGVVILGGIQVALVTLTLARRFYDTRVYTRIFREIGGEAVAMSQQAGVELTRIGARANLLREVVSFFELRLPWTLRSFVNLFGALGLLAFLSFSVFLVCLSVMGFVIILSLIFSPILYRINKEINDQQELEFDVFQSGDTIKTDEHFAKLAKAQVRRSDTDVLVSALIYPVLIGVLMFSLYNVVLIEAAPIGTVFSVLSYVSAFQIAMFTLPDAYHQLLRTVEITRRINRIDPKTAEATPDEDDSEDEVLEADKRELALVHGYAANSPFEAIRRAAPGFIPTAP